MSDLCRNGCNEGAFIMEAPSGSPSCDGCDEKGRHTMTTPGGPDMTSVFAEDVA
jgi:hypothetical protein